MTIYDFAHIDFTHPEVAAGLGRAYKLLLERRRPRRQPASQAQNRDVEVVADKPADGVSQSSATFTNSQ